MNTIVLKIDGMTCGGCVGTIEGALKKVDKVETVSVNLKNGLATIKGPSTAIPALIAAVEATGKKAVSCACNCGPGCKCAAGECGCAADACACDPSCPQTTIPAYGTVHLALAVAAGALAGIIIAKKML